VISLIGAFSIQGIALELLRNSGYDVCRRRVIPCSEPFSIRKYFRIEDSRPANRSDVAGNDEVEVFYTSSYPLTVIPIYLGNLASPSASLAPTLKPTSAQTHGDRRIARSDGGQFGI